MLPRPSIACLVLRPIVYPLPCHIGELLIVWPGHRRLTLTATTDDGLPLRWRYWPEGRLYGDLLHLFLDARIRALDVASERALLRIA